MATATENIGNPSHEPPMYLQRPSSGRSQDVSHILASTFRDLFTRDQVEAETIRNLKISREGSDPYHERYVNALQKVHDEHERRMAEATMLERHIMEAQARALSADERDIKKMVKSCQGYDLGFPPPSAHFRNCINNDLLKKHNLITPSDYASEKIPVVPPPSASDVPNYARDTSSVLNRQSTSHSTKSHITGGTREECLSADYDLDYEKDLHQPSECSDVESQAHAPAKHGKPFNNLWQEHTSEYQREQNRIDLANLESRTNYLKNPRFLPPIGGSRMLTKSQKKPPKEIGIKPTPEKDLAAELPAIFIASPSIVKFTEYKVGQAYELTLELKNVSSVLRPCRVIPATTSYFSVGLGQFPGEDGLIAPGMSCHYTIRFIPDSLGDYEDEIFVHTQATEPIRIPVTAKRRPPSLTLPSVIDVGHSLIHGACKIVHIPVKNRGGEGKFCILEKRSWPATNFKTVVNPQMVPVMPFSIAPSVFDLQPNETIVLEVAFQPEQVETYYRSISVICDNCQVKEFTLKGKGEVAKVELVNIEGGMSEPQPGEFRDIAAQHYYIFENLNPFTYLQKQMRVRNVSNVDMQFSWRVAKPHLVSPETRASGKSDLPMERYIDHSFIVEPSVGVLTAGSESDFLVVFAPPEVRDYHSVLHLVLHEIPTLLPPKTDNENEKPVSILQDVTILEVEVKGKCVPLSVTISPYGIYFPGQIVVGSAVRKRFLMTNHSMSPILFQWENVSASHIIEIEPPIGELDAGAVCELEVLVTGTEPGKMSDTMQCYVENLDEPINLIVEAEFKGPEVVIDSPDINFGLVRLGDTAVRMMHIRNTANLVAKWSIQETLACATLTDPMGESEFKFWPSGGELRPLEEKQIEVQFRPTSIKSVDTVFELSIDDGVDRSIAAFAMVQAPLVCLESCQIDLKEVYIGVMVECEVVLLNQTMLPTTFRWLEIEGSHVDRCSVQIDKEAGNLAPRERCTIPVKFTANCTGEISDIRIPCAIGGMKQPVVLAIMADVQSLMVTYASFNENESLRDDVSLDFGESVGLGNILKRKFTIKNNSAIVASFRANMAYFVARPPTPPASSQKSTAQSNTSPGRGLLKRTANITDARCKPPARANADLCKAMLIDGRGAAFTISPASATLPPFGDLTVEVYAYNDMWGTYSDDIICHINDLDPVFIPISMNVIGCPLNFQMTAASPDHRPIVRFGTHVSGVKAVTRQMRVNNPSPVDIRVDWEVFNMVPGDQQIIDLIVSYGNAFPPRDKDGSEIIPSITPEPAIEERAPTDFIVNSPDTTLAASGKDTVQSNYGPVVVSALESRPKIISVNYCAHEGVKQSKPFSINPKQLMIRARSHALVSITFTPPDNDDVTAEADLIGYALGYMSIDDERVNVTDKVGRLQAYDVEQLSIDFTARMKPASLTIECADDDSMMFRSAFSELVHETKQGAEVMKDSVKVCKAKISNFNETPLSFTLHTEDPFLLVCPAAIEGFHGDQVSTPLTLPPQKCLQTEIGFHISQDLLKYVDLLKSDADSDVTEGVTLDETEMSRKLCFKRQLYIRFNNGTEQKLPLEGVLTLPSFKLSKCDLDFGACLVGQERSLELELSNTTQSASYWTAQIDYTSESCAGDTFCFSPSNGSLEAHITHVSNSKTLVKVYFTAKHSEEYEASFKITGFLGEEPVQVNVRGRGSYDGKHEALVNH